MHHGELISGHKAFFNRTVFQAFSCQTQTYKDARSANQQMKLKFKNCIWAGIVYRIPSGEDGYEEIPGLGTKMLLLMNRMEVSNLTIGVAIWASGNITNHDRNRMVLDRVIDMINYLASLKPQEIEKVQEVVEVYKEEPEPIDSHKYPDFPSRPIPAPSPPFDMRIDTIQNRMKDIIELIDEKEARSLHELAGHTLIGKVLEIVFCLMNSVPFTVRRAKNFFMKEKLIDLLINFNPNDLKRRKIRELKHLLKHYSYLDPNKLESVSHSSVLLLEYLHLVIESLKDIELPEAIPKPESQPSGANPDTNQIQIPKKLKYRALPKPKAKIGRFMQVKEMIVNDQDEICPVKIAINVRDASLIEFSLANLKRDHASLSNDRDLNRDKSSFSRIYVNKSQDLHIIPSFKTKMSESTLLSKRKLNDFSLKSIDYNKRSQVFSKVSLEESKKTIGISNKSFNDDEMIDKVLKINTSSNEIYGLADHTNSESEILKNMKNNEIDRQPMSVLVKFAEMLKVRREAHSLL